jgi:hypothetical protein
VCGAKSRPGVTPRLLVAGSLMVHLDNDAAVPLAAFRARHSRTAAATCARRFTGSRYLYVPRAIGAFAFAGTT